ncbi:MAG: glycosyltransferase family 4 protein [Chryseolinea sp.]
MKVLFLTKYTRQGASSRVRTFMYLDFLKDNGIDVTVSPFFYDQHLQLVYKHRKHSKALYLKSFLRRLYVLPTVFRYDKVVIEKELFPYFPAVFERILGILGIRYVVDYDDAIWHNYDFSGSRLIKTLLSQKISKVMKISSLVLAGNEYISQKAVSSGARKIAYLPTVIDTSKYRVKDYQEGRPFVIGWVGSPITHKYLAALKPVFERLALDYSIRLKLVGANTGIGMPDIEEIVPWSESNEVELIQSFNVGIMPLEDNIWERGKCGYKLIQYMGCGVPVIGTPLGVNDRIITQNVTGFKANNLDEWYNYLRVIIEGGVEMEKRMGLAGRGFIESNYSLDAHRGNYLEYIVS